MTRHIAHGTPAPQSAKQFCWDLLRCFCAFEICLVHVTLPAWFTMDTAWNAGSVYIAIARAGTIGFLMLAGALLVPRANEPLHRYIPHRLRTWLQNIAGAYAIYIAYILLTRHAETDSPTLLALVNRHAGHLWFFWAIGTAYVAVIAMRWAVRRLHTLPPRTQTAVLLASVALFYAGLAALTANGGTYGNLSPHLLLIYCGHVWTGYVISRLVPQGSWLGLIPVVLGVAAAVLATQAISTEAGRNITYLNHRATLFIGLVAAGQVLLVLRIGHAIAQTKLAPPITSLARYTIGIFIIHPAVITASGWVHAWPTLGLPPALLLPLAAAALMAASLAIGWAVQASIATLLERPAPLHVAISQAD